MLRFIFIVALSTLTVSTAQAKGVFQQPKEFINASFAGQPPKPKIIWLNKVIKKQIEDILQHKYHGLRIRYYLKQRRSAWILEEIGKEKPITAGIIINQHKIEQIKVLIFRESRGWEVRYPFFTKQFTHAKLANENQLSQNIDGISGATLSVRALTKLARIALFLDKQITNNDS